MSHVSLRANAGTEAKARALEAWLGHGSCGSWGPGLDVMAGTELHEGEWWAYAIPVTAGGRRETLWDLRDDVTEEDAGGMSWVARILYGLLASAPPFNFASVGSATADPLTCREAAELAGLGRLPAGLVISAELLGPEPESGYAGGLSSFRDGYVWRPYVGETVVCPVTRPFM